MGMKNTMAMYTYFYCEDLLMIIKDIYNYIINGVNFDIENAIKNYYCAFTFYTQNKDKIERYSKEDYLVFLSLLTAIKKYREGELNLIKFYSNIDILSLLSYQKEKK